MAPNATPNDCIGEAFRSCRDFTEKIDMLIFGITLLGDDALGEQLKEWKDRQSKVGMAAVAATAGSIQEVKNAGAESAEQARQLVADERGEKVAKDLPDQPSGDALEDQVAAANAEQPKVEVRGDEKVTTGASRQS